MYARWSGGKVFRHGGAGSWVVEKDALGHRWLCQNYMYVDFGGIAAPGFRGAGACIYIARLMRKYEIVSQLVSGVWSRSTPYFFEQQKAELVRGRHTFTWDLAAHATSEMFSDQTNASLGDSTLIADTSIFLTRNMGSCRFKAKIRRNVVSLRQQVSM